MASILAGLPAARQPRLAAESALRSLPPSPASCSYQLRSTGRLARGGAAQADSFNRLAVPTTTCPSPHARARCALRARHAQPAPMDRWAAQTCASRVPASRV
jgi:hypothetical protein